MRDFCKFKYKWTDETFDLIDWDAVGKLRKGYKNSKF